MPSVTSRRQRIAAIAATAGYNPEEAAVAQSMLDNMPRDLAAISTDIKAEYGKGIESQIAIGRLLAEAWSIHGGDKVAYGRWCQTQDFPFHRNTGQLLRLAAERESEVRAYIATANDPKGSHRRDIGVQSAMKELLAGKPRASQADVVPAALADPVDPAYNALRSAYNMLFGIGQDGVATVNAFASMHVEDLSRSGDMLKRILSAYNEARSAR